MAHQLGIDRKNTLGFNNLVKFLTKYHIATIGFLGFFAIIIIAILAPWLAPYDPVAQQVGNRLASPSATHWLGTDKFGRDILTRIIWGSRSSLFISFVSIFFSCIIGTTFGLFGAYKGGLFDRLIVWITDLLLVFPTLILSLTIVVALGQGTVNVIVSFTIAYIPRFIRLVRGKALSIKTEDYIEAGRALGLADWRIIFRHILPNSTGEILVMGTLWMGSVIETEAALSFLGLGVPQPQASWGLMVKDGLSYLLTDPLMSLYPGVAIFLTVMCLNLIGDGLRDYLDPRLS